MMIQKNYDVKLIKDIQKKGELLGKIKELFAGDCEVVLFYFSGHGNKWYNIFICEKSVSLCMEHYHFSCTGCVYHL